MQKIVTIGGGTGHFQLLKGLKNYECDITAVANIADDGGSSGKLRDEYGILPPGDARQCLVALASENGGGRLRKLFNHRLRDGHSLGNLIIAGLTEIYGGDAAGFVEAGKLLKICGEVLPVSIDKSVLRAETLEGKILDGQTEVSYPKEKETRISRLFYEPRAFLYREAGEAIRKADKVVICAGDLYGSILPNLIIEGMSEALRQSNALKIYVCNLFTKQGNYDFKASDFVAEIEKYSGVEMDKIIVNNGRPSDEVIGKYFSEDSKLVEDDLEENRRVVRDEFAKEYLSEKRNILRHIPERLAGTIIGLD